MRQAMQFTFQGVTKSFKFTPEFSNVLFMMTFLQVAVFGNYFYSVQRSQFSKASYERQDLDLEADQAYETALKEVLPSSHIYLTNSAKQALSETLRLLERIHSLPEEKIVQEDVLAVGINPLKIILKSFKSKRNNLFETIYKEGLVLKALPVFSNNGSPFYSEGGNDMPSLDPDPVNPETFFGSFREKENQEEDLKEENLENPLSDDLSALSPPSGSEKKENRAQTEAGEDTNQQNGPENSPLSPKKEPSFKAFYHYNIPSKSRLLNYWMQLTAPSENVPQNEIPYREALKEIMLSKKFQPFMNEASWFADPEDTENTKLAISQMHEEAFYDYLRSIKWEETEFGTLFECPQIPGKEDFHQANPDAFNYAYELVGRCAPGLCQDEDFRVRN